MSMGPDVKLSPVHPCTEVIWPQYLHLKIIHSIVTELPLSSYKQGMLHEATSRRNYRRVWPSAAPSCMWCLSVQVQNAMVLHCDAEVPRVEIGSHKLILV